MWSNQKKYKQSQVSEPEKSKFWAFFQRSWWMLLFWGISFACYSQAMHKKSAVCLDLEEKIQDLEMARRLALEEQEDLTLQIRSQSDPEFVEMVLKKRLGVVPEGHTKVYFKKDD